VLVLVEPAREIDRWKERHCKMCLLVGPRIPGPADMSSRLQFIPLGGWRSSICLYFLALSLCLLFLRRLPSFHVIVFIIHCSLSSTCTCPSRISCSPFSHDTNLPTINTVAGITFSPRSLLALDHTAMAVYEVCDREESV